MARESQHKEIDGHKYACTMMPVRKASQTWIELVAVLGQPTIAAIAQASSDPDEEAVTAIVRGLTGVIHNLQGDVGDRLIEQVFDGIIVEGVGPLEPWNEAFDAHFRGRIYSMYKVWGWSIEVNFKDFLAVAQLLGLDQVVKLGSSALKGHLTSTDGSGTSSRVSN